MTVASLISQVNSLTGYSIPTGSTTSYIISSSQQLGSGSVNAIVNQINQLTGYNVANTNVTVSSGSFTSNPIVIYAANPASGTISTDGIYPGGIIRAEQILNIINALNGVNQNLIIISGSLYVSGSSTMSSSLAFPFAPNQDVLLSNNGYVSGSSVLDGGTF
jgi:ABC-type branched-subunit amino acid transport system substrate-binding protein